MTVEELAKLVIDHMEFHKINVGSWLPDPQNPTKLCNILQQDLEYVPFWVVNHFSTQIAKNDAYSKNNMTYG